MSLMANNWDHNIVLLSGELFRCSNHDKALKCVFTVAPTLGKHDYGDKLVLKAQASAVIEIPFSASPEPSVEWKYKGGKLTDTRRFREETVAGMTSLSMSKVTKKDAGDYSMTLQNQLGKATFTIKLIVQGLLSLRW